MNDVRIFNEKVEVVLPQIPAESVRIVVTSPPYNIGKRYGDYKDDMPRDSYLRWSRDYLTELLRVVRHEDGHLFLNVGAIPVDPLIPYDVLRMAVEAGWKLQNRIVWVKSIAVSDTLSYGHFKPINSPRFLNDVHEHIWHLMPRADGPLLEDEQEDIWHLTPTGSSPVERKAPGVGVAYQDQTNAKRWANGSDGRRCAGNAWYIPYETVQATEDKQHPCPFPYALPARALRLAGVKHGEWVMDPFMGRGTTGEAAIDLGAKFCGIDLDAGYCAVADKNLRTRTRIAPPQ